ncbi:MAG TPA: hypothetical protein VMG60_07540 [Burkholderiaceae bacterium]|nr:hypothetical protein [Burkholderiaceae bacterium]
MAQPVFRWSGEPVAFIEDWQLFDNKGLYLGWIEADNSVWAADGGHVGEFLDGKHLFRTTTALPRIPRLPRAARERCLSPPGAPPPKIMPLGPMHGWIDAFELFYPVPPRRAVRN